MIGVSEWLISRVEFSFGGQRWPLIFTHRCLLHCERLTGIDMLTVDMSKPPARLLRALLFCALAAAGAELTIEDAGGAIGATGLAASRNLITRAWIASMPEPGPSADGAARAKFTWLDAWAIARHEFKLSDEEWLDMTPRQISSLQKLRLEQLQREEFMVGMIVSHVVNFSMGAPKKPAKATDFMLHKLPEPEPITQTEEIVSQLEKMGAIRAI